MTTDESVPVRLRAILAADAVAYSRFMSIADSATVTAITEARQMFGEQVGCEGGRLFGTAGDAVMGVFDNATAAVRAALAIQSRIAVGDGPRVGAEKLRFRIGVHLGDVIETADGSVFGDGVNIAARLEALAPAGGIAVSEAVHQIIASKLPQQFTDSGYRQVKNIARPLRAYTLECDPAASSPAAQQAGAPSPSANLPQLPMPRMLFGRDRELAELGQLLEAHPVVTVLGPGGVGKTSLAIATLHSAGPRAAAQVVWIELGSITNPALVPGAVAAALAIPLPGGDPRAALAAAVADRSVLVALDNAEHLIESVTALVRACRTSGPGMRFLITSQIRLNIEEEQLFRLAPLECPPDTASVQEAQAAGAVALFLEQARAVDASFTLTEASLPSVLSLCSRLDGLPLAIKLAAARLPLFGVERLCERLSERFRLLARGSRDAPARQQALQAALDWSHSLLSPREQMLFRRLAVFTRSFSLDVAAAVAGDPGDDEWNVLDEIADLVDKSLVVPDDRRDGGYRLLESAREYALSQLRAAGEYRAANERAAAAIRRLQPALVESEPETLAWHLTEGECVLEAVDAWELAGAKALARSVQADAALHYTKAYELLERAARDGGDAADLRNRELGLLLKLGPVVMMTMGLGSPRALEIYERAVKLAEGLGDPSASFIATFNLWFIAESQMRLDDAARLIERARKLAAESGDERFMVQACHAGFSTALTTGNFEAVLADSDEGYRRYRPVDGDFHQRTFAGHDPGLCSVAHSVLGLLMLGRAEAAEAQLERLDTWIAGMTHIPSRIIGAYAYCLGFVWARDANRMKKSAEETLALCRKLKLKQYDGLFTVFGAWAAAQSGGADDVVEAVRSGLDKFESTGTKLRVSLLYAIAAETCLLAGRFTEGLNFVSRAIDYLVERGEFGWHAYALCVQAELLIRLGRVAQAALVYAQALDVGGRQGAALMERRAAEGLRQLGQAT